ncbi:unnamed protein product, partial [marine sediment metagenome]
RNTKHAKIRKVLMQNIDTDNPVCKKSGQYIGRKSWKNDRIWLFFWTLWQNKAIMKLVTMSL